MKIDGSASPHVVVSKIADKINSIYYPMPLPVIVSTKEERTLLHNQQSTRNVLDIADNVKDMKKDIYNIEAYHRMNQK